MSQPHHSIVRIKGTVRGTRSMRGRSPCTNSSPYSQALPGCQALAVMSQGAFCLGELLVPGQGSSLCQSLWGTALPAGNPGSSQILSWKSKLPLQTIMRLLQVLVPQVEKICIDK